MLETSECIPIKNNGRDYTDCMEFSLFRFMQLIFFSEEEILTNKFSNYNIYYENKLINIHNDIRVWISRFPKIYKEASFYLDGDGANEREEWAKFVSDKPYFEYYRIDGAELFTNIRNIIIFCKELLGMNLNLDDPEPDNLRNIQSILNEYTNKKIKFYINYKEKDNLDLTVPRIKAFISKPQPDIDTLTKQSYGVISKRTILNLTIDSKVYNWNLYEVYFKNENLLSNKFITGHSVIM